jgi:hypothetical protein
MERRIDGRTVPVCTSHKELAMPAVTTTIRTELDRRSDEFADVALMWVTGDGVDKTVICVYLKEDNTYFEIWAEPYLALDVFNHPFAYWDFCTYGDASRRAA